MVLLITPENGQKSVWQRSDVSRLAFPNFSNNDMHMSQLVFLLQTSYAQNLSSQYRWEWEFSDYQA